MTAPPTERAAARAKWAARLERVDSHLTQAYVHREIWQALRDEIVRVNPTADGGFLGSYTQLYAESLMTTIRRIADKDPDSDSLWATWERVRRNPAFASRQEYIDLAVAHVGPEDHDAAREQSDLHFTKSFGVGDHVDPALIAKYQQRLRDDAATVSNFVDRRIAHLDPKAVAGLDLADVHSAMDRVAANANDLHRLLDRTMVAYSLVAVPPAWRASLRSLFAWPASDSVPKP
jgi:hypothetical protein